MENLFHDFATNISLLLEALAIIIISIGALDTIARTFGPWITRGNVQGIRRAAWQSFARWLLLGLEFTLAADIVRTAVAPTWDDIGMLAAIALIRTFLNYFLERDVKEASTEST